MLDAGKIFGKGISFPPRIGPDGRVAWSEGEASVREAIRVILLTELNERVRLPNFGGSLGLFLFEPNTVTTRHLISDRIIRLLGSGSRAYSFSRLMSRRIHPIRKRPSLPSPISLSPPRARNALA